MGCFLGWGGYCMDVQGISQDDERELCRRHSTCHSQNDDEHGLRVSSLGIFNPSRSTLMEDVISLTLTTERFKSLVMRLISVSDYLENVLLFTKLLVNSILKIRTILHSKSVLSTLGSWPIIDLRRRQRENIGLPRTVNTGNSERELERRMAYSFQSQLIYRQCTWYHLG